MTQDPLGNLMLAGVVTGIAIVIYALSYEAVRTRAAAPGPSLLLVIGTAALIWLFFGEDRTCLEWDSEGCVHYAADTREEYDAGRQRGLWLFVLVAVPGIAGVVGGASVIQAAVLPPTSTWRSRILSAARQRPVVAASASATLVLFVVRFVDVAVVNGPYWAAERLLDLAFFGGILAAAVAWVFSELLSQVPTRFRPWLRQQVLFELGKPRVPFWPVFLVALPVVLAFVVIGELTGPRSIWR